MKRRLTAMLFLLYLSGCAGQAVQSGDGPPADGRATNGRATEGRAEGGWEQDPRPLAKTLVYECPGNGGPGLDFIARLGPGEMALWLEGRYVVLSQVRSASGVKYEEGNTVFWMKGDEAMLTLGGETYRQCGLNPGRAPWEDARRRGVNFRAVGDEPGWSLEIQRGRQILFAGDYGMQRVVVPDPGEQRDGPTRVYHATAGGHDLRVEIVDEICTDSMKGESFPSQVVLHLDGTTYWGCGRDLTSPWEP